MTTSNFGVPIIDSIATQRQLSRVIMHNIVQLRQQSNGRGITEEFSQDVFTDEIRVIRVKPVVQGVRTLGQATNGLAFNSNSPEQPLTQSYGIRLRHVYDQVLDIAQVSMDMIPLDLISAEIEQVTQAIAKNINASTMAQQISEALQLSYETDIAGDPTLIVWTAATEDMLDTFMDANAYLDNGDTSNGIDVFPLHTRVALLRPVAKNLLMKGNASVFDIGNWKGQDMLKMGALDPVTVPNHHADGFLGNVMGVPVHMTSNAVWTLAESWLDLSAGDLDLVYGMINASQGTGRGLAFSRTVQIIPNPRGQGIRILPLYRWGHETWFPKSVALIVTDSFTNPIDGTPTSLPVVAPESQT